MPRRRAALGHARGMAPRIDPALPLVWRSPADLQLGATEARVVLRDAGDLETGLISALRHGASVGTLTTIGLGLGGSPERVRELLTALEPAFEAVPVPAPEAAGPASRRTLAIDAAGELGARLVADLTALGHDVVDLERDTDRVADPGEVADHADPARDGTTGVAASVLDAVSIAVIAADWVVRPARHLRWLRRDVPHLAIVFDDAGARVGPLVEPGAGPCLRCLELARRDADAAWPAIAAQLAGRPSATRDARAMIGAAAIAVAAVDDRLAHGPGALASTSIRLGRARPAALPRSHRHEPHPECGCSAPGGTATAPVHLDARRPHEPSSARAGAVPA